VRLRGPLEPDGRFRRGGVFGDEKLQPVFPAQQLGLIVEQRRDVLDHLRLARSEEGGRRGGGVKREVSAEAGVATTVATTDAKTKQKEKTRRKSLARPFVSALDDRPREKPEGSRFRIHAKKRKNREISCQV
jgi:hypothetical protein